MDTPFRSSTFTASDGARLHVLEACPPGTAPGNAEPVIAFVPGWSMPAAIWRGQLLALGARHCVAALDPRGQGESEVTAGGYAIERRADDVREFIERYPRVVLVGWSLGALEALECVYRHGVAPLEGLVLVDASVGEDPPPAPGGSFLDALQNDRYAAIDDFVRAMFRTERPEVELSALVDGAMRMPLAASLSLFPRSVPREHWREIARAFPNPLLYVVTEEFAGQARSLQRNRPPTRIAVFGEAGHALFVDEADRFNAALMAFLAEIAGQPRSGERR